MCNGHIERTFDQTILGAHCYYRLLQWKARRLSNEPIHCNDESGTIG